MVTLIVGLAVAMVALAVWGARKTDFGLPKRRVRRYALHMKNDMPTITGLIVRRGPRRFVLIRAELEHDAERTEPMGGHVEVLRENVFCVQEIK